MKENKKLNLEELKELVFEKNQATKANKDKLFKLAKSNNNIELIQRLVDELSFKSAKIYLNKMDNLSPEEALMNRDLKSLKRLIDNRISVSHINLSDLAKKKYPIEYFQILLNAGSNIDKTDNDGRTALFMTVFQNNTELVKLLLNNGANANDKAYSGETALQVASSIGNVDIVTSFLEHGADINAATRDKLTPLMLAVWKGHLAVLETLLENGADLDIVDIHGVTPLIRATSEGHLEIVEFLIKQGVDINKTDNHGYSALNDANDLGHTAIQELLLEHGAEFIFDKSRNIKINLEPLTPLMVAIVKNDLDKIDELLDQTPDLTIKVNDETHPYYGKTALEIASIVKQRKLDELINLGRVTTYERDGRQKIKGHGNDIGLISRYNEAITMIEEYFFITPLPDSNITPKENINDIVRLITATYQSDYKVVQNLLNLGVDVDSTINDNWTPLLIASNFGDYEMIKLLIENGANVNVQLQDGTSAIFLASALGNIQIVKLLIDNKTNINHKHLSGHNSLMIATKSHHSDIAKELILNGINIDAFNWGQGENALSLAVINNNIEVTRLLLESGVKVNQLTQGYFTALDLCTIENKKIFSDLLIKFGAKRCNLSIGKEKQDELILNHDVFVEDLFHKVDTTITSPFIAKQFILEELDSASLVPEEDNPSAKEFVGNSGFSSIDYKGALGRSLPEVDGAIGGQQILNKWIMPYMFFKGMDDQAHKQMVVELRYKIIHLVMKKYSLGKYAKKVKKLTVTMSKDNNKNKLFNFFIFSNYLIDNNLNKYEKITDYKFYNQKYEKYIEYSNQHILVYSKTYNSDKKDDQVFYSIVEENEIYEYQVTDHQNTISHNPSQLANILKKFSNDDRLKYTNHPWDGDVNYECFMNDAKNAWNEIKNDMKALSPNLYDNIEKFLFSESKEAIGFSTPSIREKLESGKNPDDINLENGILFQDRMNDFKSRIVVKQNDKKLKLLRIFTALKKELQLSIKLKLDNLKEDNIDKFFTDVAHLKDALKILLQDIDSHADENKKDIKVLAKDQNESIEVKIIHINSTSSKTAEQLKNTINENGGNFKTIYENLSSVCDWSVDTVCKDGNRYKIDFLYPDIDNNKPHLQRIDDTIEGFTHILRFYK